MLNRHLFWLLCASFLVPPRGAAVAADENTAVGTVLETGWGKFKIKDDKNVVRLFFISKKTTRFSPDDWRPMNGDKVSVRYSEVQGRTAAKAQIDVVTLVEAGPDTPRMTSPVDVEITEVGRSGFNVKILESGKFVRFTRHRGTQMDPVGWSPGAGEKAKITWSSRSGIVFGLTYVVDRMEKIGDQEKK